MSFLLQFVLIGALAALLAMAHADEGQVVKTWTGSVIWDVIIAAMAFPCFWVLIRIVCHDIEAVCEATVLEEPTSLPVAHALDDPSTHDMS